MAARTVKAWLKAERRKALVLSLFYSAVVLTAGFAIMLLTLGLFFVVSEILILLSFPAARHVGAYSLGLALLLTAWICVDNARSRRDDMSLIPVWLIRECLYIGPRTTLEGWQSARRMVGLARLDVDACAAALSHLASRHNAVSKEELLNAFPEWNWSRLAAQLRLIDGVLLLGRDQARVTLATPLRLKFRLLLADSSSEDAETVPMAAPKNLAPHELLGISATASPREVKAAYRNRIKECHPDRFAADENARRLAEEWTKSLNAAYRALMTRANAGGSGKN